MKNKINYLVLLFLFSITFVSCQKKSIENAPVNIELQLTVDENEIWFDVPFQNANVVLTNKSNNVTNQLEADASGKILLNNIAPGLYSINVSLKITPQEYLALTGQSRDTDFFLNFSADNQSFYEDKKLDLNLITTDVLGGFVFKQIFYAGSNTSRGAGVRDHFIEIYNNSSETLYADSLLIVVAYGKTNNNVDEFSLPNRQFDWSKSIGMTAQGDANEDFIYAKAVFMIPSDGTGKKYPVAPGNSIILAQSAVDHTSNYMNNSGNLIGVQDPSLTVDLSQADFEVWLYPYEQKIQPGRAMFASDVDNPDVPNVETFFATGMRDLILNPQGRDSYVLLKVDNEINLENLPSFPIPTVRNVSSSTTLYPQLPTKYVLDAVEVEAPVSSDRIPRRLPLKLDAGAASVEAGPYSSQSIVRKTQKMVNGRRILQDTNNSAQDFVTLQKADVSKSNTSFNE